MRLGLLVVAASLRQVSAQAGSGANLMGCHTISGNIETESYTLKTCNQTGSWNETGATTCFIGKDSYGGATREYAGCGQEIDCRGMYDTALAKGLITSDNITFCIENFSGYSPVETPTYSPGSGGSGMVDIPVTVTMCCQAITDQNYHQASNEWGAVSDGNGRDIDEIIDRDTTVTLTNDQVAAVATEEEEDDDETIAIALGSVGGVLFLGSVAYIIKKKVYDKDASFMPLEFLL